MNNNVFKAMLYALTKELDLGVHIILADHKSVLYNQSMAKLEGQSEKDVLLKDFRAVFSSIKEEDSTLLRAIHNGEPTYNREQRYLNRYGKWIHTVNTTIPFYDLEGKILGAIEIAKDITQIKEMSDKLLSNNSNNHEALDTIKTYTFDDLKGESPEFLKVIEYAKRAAHTDASVFLYGETGTGKELVAQSIHSESKRRSKPFLAQNCAALPESLLEGILFGTAKGGFTGALDREGLFEQAKGGTLLLDEISAMPYALQGKLLRVLQEEYIRRVGGIKDIPVDVRIIATVNEEADKLIRENRLRKDLYYRLNVVNLRLPPLRGRQDDILLLTNYFIERYNNKNEAGIEGVSEEALEKLYNYSFPGNVRELKNLLMNAATLMGDYSIIEEDHIRVKEEEIRDEDENLSALKGSLDKYIEEKEKSLIALALKDQGGNISQASRLLGIKRQTLQHKIRKYQLKGDI